MSVYIVFEPKLAIVHTVWDAQQKALNYIQLLVDQKMGVQDDYRVVEKPIFTGE